MPDTKLMWQAWATWTTYAGNRIDDPPVPPNLHFATGTNPIGSMQSAIAACNTAKGGFVYVGCDYTGAEDYSDAFAMLYQSGGVMDPAKARLELDGVKDVVIDFGGATLRCKDFTKLSGGGYTQLIKLLNCERVTIQNLRLDGNRRGSLSDPAGALENELVRPDHGIAIYSCKDITFRNVHVLEAQVDGFHLGELPDGEGGWTPNERIVFEDCSAVRCGRVGLAIHYAFEVKVVRCSFRETGLPIQVDEETVRLPMYGGPADGAHLELDRHYYPAADPQEYANRRALLPGARNVTFQACEFVGNGFRGLALLGQERPDGALVVDCRFSDNGRRMLVEWGVQPAAGLRQRYVHLYVGISGTTVENCSFEPNLATFDYDTEGAHYSQASMVFVFVPVLPPYPDPDPGPPYSPPPEGQNPVPFEGYDPPIEEVMWAFAPVRFIGNRFVGLAPDSPSVVGERIAIEIGANSALPVHMDGNRFRHLWAAVVTFRGDCRFTNNVVEDGVVVGQVAGKVNTSARAITLAGTTPRTVVSGNRFSNVAGEVLWMEAGWEGCEDLVFSNNQVIYDQGGPTLFTGVDAAAAVHLSGRTGGRVHLVDNLFVRSGGSTEIAAIYFNLGGTALAAEDRIVLRGNLAASPGEASDGWLSAGAPSGAWSFYPTSYAQHLCESWGNTPISAGDIAPAPGVGLRIHAPAADPSSPPDGALWIGVDSPNTGALMFKPSGGAPVNVLAGSGDVSGPGSATDGAIAVFDGTSGALLKETAVSVDGADVITGALGLTLAESSTSPTTGAGEGTFWVENTDPSRPMFTDDAGQSRRMVLGLSGTSDNALVRYDGTSGTVVQSSGVLLNDSHELSGVSDLTVKAAQQLELASVAGALRMLASGNLTFRPGNTETALLKAGGGLTLKGHTSAPSASLNEGVFWTTDESYTQPKFTNANGALPLVRGPTSATSNALPRFDGTSGGLLKTSVITVDDSGNLILQNSDFVYWGSAASTTRVSGSSSSSLTLRGSTTVEVDNCPLGLSNNQDLRWGSSTATSILGSSAGGGDLTLNAADDVFLNPMDDLFVQANNATYAAFDGGAYRLGLDSDASVGHYATTLTVRGDVNATTATSFVANVVNKNTGAYVRVLKLAVGRSSDSTTAFFVRAFQNDAVGNGSGTLKWYVRSDGVTPDTFTGKHYVIYEAEPGGRAELELEPGFIVETAGRIWSERRVDQCLPVVRLCRTPACKKVFGVVAPDWKADRDFHIWSECAEALHPDSQADVNEAEGTVEPATVPFDPASRLFKGRVNSVGEGMVWVTDAAGPVEEGDYITSSAIPGHGARQEDDLLHSYTVAKCTEAPDWSKAEAIPFEAGFVRRLLVACTYHCG